MRVCLALLALSEARGLRRGRDVDVDLAGQVWIPIQPDPADTFYYNPIAGISVRTLPAGARTTHVQLELIAGSSHLIRHEDDVLIGNTTTSSPVVPLIVNTTTQATTPGVSPAPAGVTAAPTQAPAATTTAASQTPAATTTSPTLVPDALRHSCVPHCLWNCTEPVCEQNCKPDCAVPSCQTQCPKRLASSFVGCKVRCGEPNCAMYCPPDPCMGSKSLNCVTPKCTTRCERPKCSVDCGHSHFGCKTVCPPPSCRWKCAKPTCPKPVCTMSCEVAPRCQATAMSVAPPAHDETVVGRKVAVAADPEWKAEAWGSCSSRCGEGTQTRSVQCTAGEDAYCSGPRPISVKSCVDYQHCRYNVGPWSLCSEKCSKGTRTRTVECAGRQCFGDKPASEEVCHGRAPTCQECTVTLWGGRRFAGWKKSFEPGNYSAAELEFRGVKCDDISSLEVVGDFCKLVAFEFGDFNNEHPGWEAEFRMGKHDTDAFAPHGARNNDMSSFQLIRLPQPREQEDEAEDSEAENVDSPSPFKALDGSGSVGPRLGGPTTPRMSDDSE